MNRKHVLLAVAVSLVATGQVWAATIVPTLDSSANTNSFSTATPDKLNDNSGMTPAVNNGDALAAALAATHANTGVFESWVTNANAPDYYGVNPPTPTFVWDLGIDTVLDAIVLWQYQNDGGGQNRVGNHARTIELRFNTDAQGTGSFAGAATTISMAPVVTGDPNVAQGFGLSQTARYVEMRVTDNHFGDPDGFGVDPQIGGDRVGLGEVRFHGEPVPEPSSLVLLAVGLCGSLVAGRRRKRTVC